MTNPGGKPAAVVTGAVYSQTWKNAQVYPFPAQLLSPPVSKAAPENWDSVFSFFQLIGRIGEALAGAAMVPGTGGVRGILILHGLDNAYIGVQKMFGVSKPTCTALVDP